MKENWADLRSRLQKFKIGILREPFWNVSDPNLAPLIPVLERCLRNLNETGLAAVVDPVTFPFVPVDRQKGNLHESVWFGLKLIPNFNPIPKADIVFRHEFKHSVNVYLANDIKYRENGRNRTVYSLADVIEFNKQNPPAECYNQRTLILSEATNGLRNKTYVSSLHEYQRDAKQYLDSIFNNSDVDALATPCYVIGTPLLYSHGAAAGYPSLTVGIQYTIELSGFNNYEIKLLQVPVSTYSTGLPFGLCLLGRPFSEPVLLKLGYFIEQSRDGDRPVPRFL